MNPSQFSLRRLLVATVLFGVAAGLLSTMGSLPADVFFLSPGLIGLGGGAGIGLLAGRPRIWAVLGFIIGLLCAAGMFLYGLSMITC